MSQGLLCDLLWSDPDKDITGWSENDRGVSFTFGPDVVSRFLQKHDMDLICRAHQVVEDGYEFFAKRQLVTLFSAPNYCGEFDNAGAMMSVDETLMCSFQVNDITREDEVDDECERDREHLLTHYQYIFFLLYRSTFTDSEASRKEAKVFLRSTRIREAGDTPTRQEKEGDGQGHLNHSEYCC